MPRTPSTYKPDMNIEGVSPGDIQDGAIESRHIGEGEIESKHLAPGVGGGGGSNVITRSIAVPSGATFPLPFIDDADIGVGKKFYPIELVLYADGADFVGGPGTVLHIESNGGLEYLEIDPTQLINGAVSFGIFGDLVGPGPTMNLVRGGGFPVGEGLKITSDDSYSAGSTLYITITGIIK